MIIKTFLETAGNFEERELLTKFHQGIESTLKISAFNDLEDPRSAYIDIGREYSNCDVAIVMGSWKERDNLHHNVRQSIVKNSKCFVVVETPLLGRVVSKKNTHLRVGVNGFLNNSGKFITRDCPNDRLTEMNIMWNGWHHNKSGDIYVLLQLPGDASLRQINIYSWAMFVIENVRKYSDRKIVIRTHPGHTIKDNDEFYKFIANLLIMDPKVSVSLGKDTLLQYDLKNAYCTITYSSGSGIDSILQGVPTIATDPGNFAWDVSSRYISDINNLSMPDDSTIPQWLQNLSYSQWTVDEMLNGTVWKHLHPIISAEYLEIQSQTKKKK
jgi:hypothetical protein